MPGHVRWPPRRLALAGIVALAAVLRLMGLDQQSFSGDESVTVLCFLDPPLDDGLSVLPDSERTPPLYYVLGWLWAQVVGIGEVGSRSFSAVVGIVSVPVTYAAAANLVSRRAGLASSALVAANPLLVGYSQQARAYALMVLLIALSMLFFARALAEPSRRWLALWALFASLATATHYFAVFTVMAQSAFLLVMLGPRTVLPAAGGVVAAGATLLPLALYQENIERTDFIGAVALKQRVRDTVTSFMFGEGGAPLAALEWSLAALIAAALALLILRARGQERRGGIIALGVAAGTVAIPLVATLARVDYVLDRNLIAALVPLSIAVGTGLAASRLPHHASAAATAAVVGVLATVSVATNVDPSRQRNDWRGLSAQLAAPSAPRAILGDPGIGSRTMRVYRKGVRAMHADGVQASELVLLAQTSRAATLARPGPGWKLAQRDTVQKLVLLRFQARVPQIVRPMLALPGKVGSSRGKNMVELPAASGPSSAKTEGFCRSDWGEFGSLPKP